MQPPDCIDKLELIVKTNHAMDAGFREGMLFGLIGATLLWVFIDVMLVVGYIVYRGIKSAKA